MSPFSPTEKRPAKYNRCMKASSTVQRYREQLCYTANNDPFEHLWQVDQAALVDPVHLEAQEDP